MLSERQLISAERAGVAAGVATKSLERRRLADAAARWVVGSGGLAAVISIVAILGFICIEIAPLWKPAAVRPVAEFRLPPDVALLAPMVDEYRRIVAGVTANGVVRFVDARDGRLIRELREGLLAGGRVGPAVRAGGRHVLIVRDDAQLAAFRIGFDVTHVEGKRVLEPRITEVGTWTLPTGGVRPVLLGGSAPEGGGIAVVFALPGEEPVLYSVTEKKSLLGPARKVEVTRELSRGAGEPMLIQVNAAGSIAYIGSSTGRLQAWDASDRERPRLLDEVQVSPELGVPVTAAEFLAGERSLVVGDGAGGVSVWFPVRDAARASGWRLQRAHDLEPHRDAVTAIASSPRDRSFLTADRAGTIKLHHATTEQTLSEVAVAGPVRNLLYAPKGDGAIAMGGDGIVSHWEIENRHPEVTFESLFGKVWYEGYAEPEFVWQSTGGTDEFEPKLSLVPLMLGTVKGTLYALLFAVPIAVLAALYTSQFSDPRLRGLVKPTVELMAALPSVVLGFLAGLWLAPVIEPYVPALLAMLPAIPALIFVFGTVWYWAPASLRARVGSTGRILILVALMAGGVQLCLWANPLFESWFFGGDFQAWLYGAAGLRFDQRNCLVIGFAMGFAVIPIIFTISEDALSNVPQRLVSASLALGATRWQTAVRVVLPTASAGIFSAIMIGLGRAVGETMIVLMATGNTPILDWNIFTGMRTLSANIAVEVPEAPHGSTLYRVLFLTALLLFVTTFILNTAAELVRARLRRRYQQL